MYVSSSYIYTLSHVDINMLNHNEFVLVYAMYAKKEHFGSIQIVTNVVSF